MSGGLATRPKSEEPWQAENDEYKALVNRLASGMRTEKPNLPSAEALPPEVSVLAPNSRLEDVLMPKGKSAPEATVSPEDMEVIGVKGEQVSFRNRKTGEVYPPSRFMNVPGFEDLVGEAMLRNQGGFQKGVGK
jgi:hypothetical protein